ncbi:MAG: lysophospholipid acyltransferase family protein [Actinomycetota bacterium]
MPARQARRAILAGVLKPVVWYETEPCIEGLDNLAGLRGPVIFVSNHASHLDATLLLCSLPKGFRHRTAVGAASDYFFDVWWRYAATALAFNAFPVDRTSARRMIATARGLIEDGWSLVLFPEGTRSPDGWVHEFHRAPASLCVQLGIPAVPVGIRGNYAAMPRGRSWPVPGRAPVAVRYGRALSSGPGEHARSFNERVYKEVARLWDEDATTWWESLQRAERNETPDPTGPEGARWRRIWEGSRPLDSRRRRSLWS